MNEPQRIIYNAINTLIHPSLQELKYYIDNNSYFYKAFRKYDLKKYSFYYYHLKELVDNNHIYKLTYLEDNRRRYCVKNDDVDINYITTLPSLLHKDNKYYIKYDGLTFEINIFSNGMIEKTVRNNKYTLITYNRRTAFLKNNILLGIVCIKKEKIIMKMPDKIKNKLDYEILNKIMNKNNSSKQILCVKGKVSITGG